MAKQRKILSVGGSIIIPKTGFDTAFLKKFRAMILKRVEAGEQFILVIGGGTTARVYQQAARGVRKMSDDDLDWIGISATVINAHFVKMLFGAYAYKEVVRNPLKKVRTTKPIICAAGLKPGSSTDLRAVQFAKTYGSSEVMNLSNISYVYDKDPNKYTHAKKIEQIGWQSFREDIVGDTWSPGKNVPFDPIASKLAQQLGLTVSMLDGNDLKEVRKALRGKRFRGTVIHP